MKELWNKFCYKYDDTFISLIIVSIVIGYLFPITIPFIVVINIVWILSSISFKEKLHIN